MIKYKQIEEQAMRYSEGIPLSTKAEKEFKRVPVSITCDVCGREIPFDQKSKDFHVYDLCNFIKVRQDMGYGSHSDGDKLSVDFCHECFIKMCHEKIGKEYFEENCVIECY